MLSTKRCMNVTAILALGSFLALAQTASAQTPAAEPLKAAQQRVNINKADAETIADVLVGVGASKAKAIVEYREQNGPFTNLDQLIEVNGIGQSILETNKDRLAVE